MQVRHTGLIGQTGPIGKNTTLSSHCPVALDDVWAERSEPAPRSLSSFPVVRAGEGDVLPAQRGNVGQVLRGNGDPCFFQGAQGPVQIGRVPERF
jgi:hypothetical protein